VSIGSVNSDGPDSDPLRGQKPAEQKGGAAEPGRSTQETEQTRHQQEIPDAQQISRVASESGWPGWFAYIPAGVRPYIAQILGVHEGGVPPAEKSGESSLSDRREGTESGQYDRPTPNQDGADQVEKKPRTDGKDDSLGQQFDVEA